MKIVHLEGIKRGFPIDLRLRLQVNHFAKGVKLDNK